MAKKKRPTPGRRVRNVLVRSLLLTVPSLLISLAIQGYREFKPEIEAYKKYQKILDKIKKKG